MNECKKKYELKFHSNYNSLGFELVRHIIKFYQNLCEGHNGFFQHLLFNLTILKEQNLTEEDIKYIQYKRKNDLILDRFPILDEFNKKNPKRQIFIEEYFDIKDPDFLDNDKLNLKAINTLDAIEDNKYTLVNFILLNMKVLLFNCKLSNDKINLLYDNKKFNNSLPLVEIHGKLTDLLIEMIQSSDKNHNHRFLFKINLDEQINDNERVLDNCFSFVKYLQEIKILFNENNFQFEPDTIKIKLNAFCLFNNLISQENKENESIIKAFLRFFPIEDLMTVVVFYFKVLYFKYIMSDHKMALEYSEEHIEKITNIVFTENILSRMIQYYKENLDMYEDDLFKLPAQIFLCILMISEKYQNPEAKVLIGYSERNKLNNVDIDEHEFEKFKYRGTKKNDFNDNLQIFKNDGNESKFIPGTSNSYFKNKIIASRFFSFFTRQCEFIIKKEDGEPEPDQKELEQEQENEEDEESDTSDSDKSDDDPDAGQDENSDTDLTKAVDNNVKVIYFFIDPRCYLISKHNIAQFFEKVDRTSSTTKLKGLVEELNLFHSEVKFKLSNLKQNEEVKGWMGYDYEKVDIFNFVISCVINFILLVFLDKDKLTNNWFYLMIIFFSLTQIAVNSYYLYFFFKSKYKYIVILGKERLGLAGKKRLSFHENFKVNILYSALNSEINLLYLNLLIPFICLFSTYAAILFPLQLFTVVKFVRTIKEIVNAFQLTFNQILAMIGFLAILILFYANLGFYFMKDQFDMQLDSV